jgi:CheY-like chemotaxis protein
MVGSVLLYEDDCAIREFVAEVLSDEGHQVLVCDSLQAVQRAAEADPSALALVDTWDASFYRLAAPQRQAICSLAERVPTVMLTTHAWALETTAEELGLLALVPMPMDLDQLVETVGLQMARLLEQSQAAQERSHQVNNAWQWLTRGSIGRRPGSSVCSVPSYHRTAARTWPTPPPASCRILCPLHLCVALFSRWALRLVVLESAGRVLGECRPDRVHHIAHVKRFGNAAGGLPSPQRRLDRRLLRCSGDHDHGLVVPLRVGSQLAQ